ncbi:histidine phosphotransferase family protein [Antarcticimicrobium luteum]|uniref:Histidine phosphotransferase n=1 Tax=Antarcticimicrobium luteum TaxID=2547397 RepID=A0A4R5V0B1_9RHOB|nr:histidine phosphotransferase family protein [Antarcticimicrobium luteum]TDK45124.1 histidine phosphotransferase [Antarcticimicrobium luteum]
MENPSQVNPQDDAPDIGALIASRICHDLIGPVGAIVNGMELLELAGGTSGPEQELIAQSAASASARLRFFRIAFGAAGDQAIGGTDIAILLEEVGRDGRMQVVWTPEGAQPRNLVKLAFLALLCCETALPRGGRAHVIEEDGAWVVTASGEPVTVDPALWAWLEGASRAAALIPARVQFALLPQAATQMGRRLGGEHDAQGLTLRF